MRQGPESSWSFARRVGWDAAAALVNAAAGGLRGAPAAPEAGHNNNNNSSRWASDASRTPWSSLENR
jgi:hypothetical protein